MGDQESTKKNYLDNLKTTLLFSGVQVYQILVRIIRSKFVAMFIGPEGMGIMSLLHASTDLISASTNLGLKTSGVRSVAEANSESDKQRIGVIAFVLRRLIFLTGMAGMLICIALSSLLSKTSFGSYDYTWSFIFVSVIILFEQLNNGEQVLLQGLQKRKYLANANLIGSTIGLFIMVPLYYFFKKDAIVWVLVISYLISLIISKVYTSKLELQTVNVPFREIFIVGKDMIKLGMFLSVQLVFSQLAMYVVRNYVSNVGSLDDVGLYSAGSTIINMYLGLVFTAMATDYFPRLAKTKSHEELCDTIKQQAEIALLMFAPIVVVFIVFIKLFVVLLYSELFLQVESMLYWAMGGTLIKALSWSVSYSIVAKSSPKVYFWNEFVSIIYTLALNILGYRYFGLMGLGISIVISYTIYLLQVLIVAYHIYSFRVSKSVFNLFLFFNFCVLLTVLGKIFLPPVYAYFFGIFILILVSFITIKKLDERTNILDIIYKRINRNDSREK